MSTNKGQEFKEFLITERKKTSSGISVAPVWIMQKAEKRLYNARQSRHWTMTKFGSRFRSKKKAEGK